MIRFDLPLGPSVNQMFPGKERRFKSREYRSWISEAGWHIRAMRPPPFRVEPYSVLIRVPEKMRGDPDNRIKAVVDLLVRNSVTPDDKHARSITVERHPEAFPGRCVVYVNFTNGAENVESTDKHDSGNSSAGSDSVREPDAVAGPRSDPA